jgi:Eco57I restriction-modification methylase
VTATAALTTELQRMVLGLEDDLRARLAADPALEGRWKQEHHEAVQKERTAAAWTSWRDDRVTQAAVAWVLTTVFIRFCEDNGLLRPVWITGPGSRRQEALDAQLAFFRQHPEDTDREWLQDAVGYLSRLPATRALVESHSALHLISPSGDAAGRLLEFWRRRSEDGALVHDLADPPLSTRFLGDLYQDLSQYAKDTYALLQTPVFVEEFILDRTMEPALAERPLERFRLIDPTCGSGHFLLGAFDRLLDRWHKHAPDLDAQARVQAALDAIHGIDLNPFAVAIARFRLALASLQACGLGSLEQAPAFTLHLAVGDSLIHGPDNDVLPGMVDRSAFMPFTYATEDSALLLKLLEEGRYDVVVGNPPYITVKDKALNQIYRAKYADVCTGTYALTVPFMKLFFALAKSGERAGWIGQITSNSFMKRKFGSKLIEDFLAHKDLRLVADTSGAYIPGHGTPTVILVGRNHSPVGATVRAVLGVRGEPGRPDEPAKGLVWSSITEHVDQAGSDDGFMSVADIPRSALAVHPWSLSGGGRSELRASLEVKATERLRDRITQPIGGAVRIGSDDAFVFPNENRFINSGAFMRQYLTGEDVRDWSGLPRTLVAYPYGADGKALPNDVLQRLLWRNRTLLANRATFQGLMADAGRTWWEYMQHTASAYASPLGINFANVATHNHFALTRGNIIFNAHAPVIKLSAEATEDEHLALLGVLNSSTACFWLKQNSHNKGEGGGARVDAGYAARGEPFRESYEFTGTTLQDYPLPDALPMQRARVLDGLAQDLAANSPGAVCGTGVPLADILAQARLSSEDTRARMIALQDELDWEFYRLYGLVEEDLTYVGPDLPGLVLGERAFEIALARTVASGNEKTTWFSHPEQRATPITEIPSHWPAGYRKLVQRRLDLIASDPFIRLLEKPEYKRRWAQEPWEKRQEKALRDWLLDRLEDRKFWFDPQGRPRPRSVAQLADDVSRDPDLVSVLALWEGRPDIPVTQSLIRLLADEAVPFLAAYRYKDSGLRKREAWEETWALQRREDSGENVGAIPVPPKYAPADFRKTSYWRARGKLDVPKERFILYPDAGRETDPTALLGWAGWDHAQQSLTLSVIITDREKDGWPDDRLIPLVAGLAELQPWVEQWHADIDPDYNLSLAVFCREQLIARAAQVARTIPELAAWRPDAPTRGRRRKRDETKMDSS